MNKSLNIILLGLSIGILSIFTLLISIKIAIIQFAIGLIIMLYAIYYIINKE
jgi:hypothetical protein